MIGGQEKNAYGAACRSPDGAWKIQPAGAKTLTETAAVPTAVVALVPPHEEIIVLDALIDGEPGVIVFEEETKGTIIVLQEDYDDEVIFLD